MTVLEILNSYPGETFIREHARAILRKSTVELAWAFAQTSLLGDLPKPVSGLSYCFAMPNFNRLSKSKKITIRLRRPLRSWHHEKEATVLRCVQRVKPDVIHFQFASTAVQWSWIAKKLNVPFTFSVRGSDVQVLPLLTKHYLERLKKISVKSKRIHAVCDNLKSLFCDLTGIPAAKVDVIRTVVSDRWKAVTREPEPNLFISVGRLHWSKGFPDLVVAAKLVKDRGGDFKLLIIGEGPERAHIEYLIRDLNLKDCVRLEGAKSHSEIQNYFRKATAIVLSSLLEGFPNVLAEAMLAGVPIISTNCGGIGEILQDKKNAWIVQTGAPDDLASQMMRCLDNKVVQERLARIAQKQAESIFSPEQHCRDFLRFWQVDKGST